MASLRRWQIVDELGDRVLATVGVKQAQQAAFHPKPRYPMTPKVLRLLRNS
jgi:hypothetical protein